MKYFNNVISAVIAVNFCLFNFWYISHTEYHYKGFSTKGDVILIGTFRGFHALSDCLDQIDVDGKADDTLYFRCIKN